MHDARAFRSISESPPRLGPGNLWLFRFTRLPTSDHLRCPLHHFHSPHTHRACDVRHMRSVVFVTFEKCVFLLRVCVFFSLRSSSSLSLCAPPRQIRKQRSPHLVYSLCISNIAVSGDPCVPCFSFTENSRVPFAIPNSITHTRYHKTSQSPTQNNARDVQRNPIYLSLSST